MDSSRWYKHRLLNLTQTVLLLCAMAALLGYLGWQLGGLMGVLVAAAVVAGVLLFNPMTSPHAVLKMHKARVLPAADAPALVAALATLSQRAQLEQTPTLYLAPGQMINAFAVGSGRESCIAITQGVLQKLSFNEVVGVLAHEVAHVRNNDVWVMGVASLFSRLTDSMSMLGLAMLFFRMLGGGGQGLTIGLLIFAPTLSVISQAALSRTREYDADLNGALLCGHPRHLARALAKIAQHQGRVFERIFVTTRRLPESSMFSTHPPVEERIRRLLELERDVAGLPSTP